MLGITDPNAVFCGQHATENPEEISLDLDSDEESSATGSKSQDETEGMTSVADDDSQDSDERELPNASCSENFPTFIQNETMNDSLMNMTESDVDSSFVTKPDLPPPKCSHKSSDDDMMASVEASDSGLGGAASGEVKDTCSQSDEQITESRRPEAESAPDVMGKRPSKGEEDEEVGRASLFRDVCQL